MDGTDIAAVIGAVCVGIPVVGGFVLQVMTFNRQAKRDAKLEAIKLQVDGLGEKREAMALRAGQAEGRATGVAEERAAAPPHPLGGNGDAPIPVVVIAEKPIPVVETSGKPLK